MSYKVFLSYSWSNSAERRALQHELESVASVEVLVDSSEIRPGEAIHARVLQMIDAADCVIVFLTTEGLQSREVLDELSRCHDRGVFIIPVIGEETSLEALPWHVRDLRGIKYDNRNFDDVVHAIVSAVSLRANPLDDIRANVPKRLRNLVNSGTPFLDVPLPRSYEGDSMRPDYLYCELYARS
jgi:TIR domain